MRENKRKRGEGALPSVKPGRATLRRGARPKHQSNKQHEKLNIGGKSDCNLYFNASENRAYTHIRMHIYICIYT